MQVFARIFDYINNIAASVAAVMIMFMMLSVSADVVMRYFFNRPMIWTAEVARIMLLYMAFLGTAWVSRRGGHVTVDILFIRLSSRNQRIIRIISSIIGVIICLVFVWYGTQVTWDHFQRGIRTDTELTPLKAPILAAIPIGGAKKSV